LYRIKVISRTANLIALPSRLLVVVVSLLFGASPARAQVVINEVMANNETVVANDGQFPAWVELYNTTAAAVDISDWSLSDSLSSPRKFIFPAGTVIPASDYLAIWLDDATNSPGLHTVFDVKARAGDDLTLFNAPSSGGLQVDRVVFGIQAEDVSIGRVPNATGAWMLTVPTFEFANQPIPLGAAVANNLYINEVMPDPESGEDWFELYNTTTNYIDLGGLVFTDRPTGATNRAINALSFIAPGGFLQLFASEPGGANPDADQLDFKLSNSGEQLTMYQPDRATMIDRVSYTSSAEGAAFGRLPDGSGNIITFAVGRSTPEASNFQLITDIIINEVLTHTDPPLEDAIELYNPTANPVDISYWWLSDSKDDPKKFQIPAGTVIPAGGYKVFYEAPGTSTGFNPNGQGTDRSFSLNSARGDEVYLHTGDAAGNLTFFRTSRDFGPAENGVSFGRYVKSDGTTDFVAMSQHTFGVPNPANVEQFRTGTGATNAYPKIGPVVISEIHYHPPDEFIGGLPFDNTTDEFVELYNLAPTTTPLFDPAFPTNTWRLRGTVDFDFPQNVSLAPGEYAVVVSFDPVANPAQLATFRARFGVPDGAKIYGPFEGKLQNGNGDVELYKPDFPQIRPPDVGMVPYVRVEQIEYSDTAPWPTAPDGNGSSLQRRFPEQYGNDPINWVAAVPAPATVPPVRIESVQRLATATTIQFTAAANQGYTLQYNTELLQAPVGTSTNSWRTAGNIAAQPTGGLRTVTDTTADPMRFYRIVTE
jgi:hypothetical protein